MKEKLKKIPGLLFIWHKVETIKNMQDFNKDKKIFKKYYIYRTNTKEKIEYSLMLNIHQIEKAFTVIDKRPFGIKKIKNIISLIEKYESFPSYLGYYYDLSLSCLEKYKELYEEKNWTTYDEYIIVKDFLQTRTDNYKLKKVGALEITKEEILTNCKIDYINFLNSRHSIRIFDNKKLELDDIEMAVRMALLTPTACNRQMCKIYYLKSKESKQCIEKFAQGLSLFELDNANYFLITFDISSFVMVGERNQGWFNAGLVSMNFVNALHSLGIGSCFCQFGNSFNEEKKLKKFLLIPENERIAVILVAGYYPNKTYVPCSVRKDVKDIFTMK